MPESPFDPGLCDELRKRDAIALRHCLMNTSATAPRCYVNPQDTERNKTLRQVSSFIGDRERCTRRFSTAFVAITLVILADGMRPVFMEL